MKKMIVLILLMQMVFLVSYTAAKEKRTVVMWSFRPSNIEEYRVRTSEIEDLFGIKFEIRVILENVFIQKIQTAMSSGTDAPDIVEWMIENNRIMDHDPRKSLLMPLDRFIAKSRVTKIVPEGRIDWVRYGKHIYGLPHDAHPCLLVYNDTIWKSVGVDMAKIETWDEFFEAAKKLAAVTEDGKQKHYALPYGSVYDSDKKKEGTNEDGLNNTMFMIWQQTGAQILDENGNPQFTSPEFRSFVEKWFEWRKSGAFTSWDWGNFGALLANGTFASYVSPDWWIPQVNLASTGSTEGAEDALHGKKVKRVGVKYQFRVRLLPAYQKGGPKGASWGGIFFGIPKGTKDPVLIYRIIEYLQYNNESCLIRWKEAPLFPPNRDIWHDPSFHKADARFGGQRLGELMIASAWGLPRINTGAVFWDAINIFSEEYKEIISGKKTIDDACAAAQKRTFDKMKGK